MKYKCLIADQFETWLSVGKVYEGDIVVSPPAFAGGWWIELYRADDGFKSYCRSNQFEQVRATPDNLGVN